MNTDNTRVSAKYIRKMAKIYGIEISLPLRTNRVKAYYVQRIAAKILIEIKIEAHLEAITKMNEEEMSTRDLNTMYESEIKEAIAEVKNKLEENRFYNMPDNVRAKLLSSKICLSIVDSFEFQASLHCGSTYLGRLGVNVAGKPWFRLYEDSKYVQRGTVSLKDAVNRLLVTNHPNSRLHYA